MKNKSHQTTPDSVTTHRIPWDKSRTDIDTILNREWLVANGLGGYASRTLARVCTRKYHGLLVAALPAPFGRMVMLTGLYEELRFPDGSTAEIGGEEHIENELLLPGAEFLTEFRLELGLPVWRYEVRGYVIEKRVVLPHRQNTTHINYRLVSGSGRVRIRIRPSMHFRSQAADSLNTIESEEPYTVKGVGNRYEISANGNPPVLRLFLYGTEGSFNLSGGEYKKIFYRVEKSRCYDCRSETLWS
ncbi:MAG TPA: glycogen debranching enzyme N-terminal domain-containing protein, partial [Methanomicrobiales archaeon]|nr:glycogen debranching enzyme N-terminal domain-containing protein [Methanomicrobiales archaeon]